MRQSSARAAFDDRNAKDTGRSGSVAIVAAQPYKFFSSLKAAWDAASVAAAPASQSVLFERQGQRRALFMTARLSLDQGVKLSTKTRSRMLAVSAMTLLLAGGLTGSASASSASASGSVSVFVPGALNTHQLCVSSTTTGTVCQDVPGAPEATLTVEFTAEANITPPSASVAQCGGGAIVTIASGGGTLSGSATVSGLLLSPVTVPIETTTTPGDSVTVSFCEKP